MSGNIAKIVKVARNFVSNQKDPLQISQKSQKQQGIFLLAKNTLYKYRKNNRYNKTHDFGKEEAPKWLKNRKSKNDFSC